MTDTFSELSKLAPKVSKYRKLLAALVTTTIPYLVFLVEPHSAQDIIEATGAYLLVNLGVYGVSNEGD